MIYINISRLKSRFRKKNVVKSSIYDDYFFMFSVKPRYICYMCDNNSNKKEMEKKYRFEHEVS